MRSIRPAMLVALMAVFTLAGSALAEHQRPMKGRYEVGVVNVVQRCPDAITIGFEGVGHATHLGRMEGTGSNCTSPDLTTQAVPIYDGLATFVAADGSSITASYEGMQDAPVAGVASVVQTFTVIGGTGRFEGATGTWSGSGEINFLTGGFSGQLSGWVSY